MIFRLKPIFQRFSEMYGVVFLIKRVFISVSLSLLEQVLTRLLATPSRDITSVTEEILNCKY